MRGNTVTIEVSLKRGKMAKTVPLYQYDYGQKLIFTNVELPSVYEVHFSNELHGESVTMIGDSTGVLIPDSLLTTGLPVYLWAFLHTDTDDGETEYTGIIPVIQRARPSDVEPTQEEQSVITQAIAALNAGVETVENAVENIDTTIQTSLQEAKESGLFDGADGQDGQDGQDGFTPTVDITSISGGYQMTITNSTGASVVNVMNGVDGSPGADGNDGADGQDGADGADGEDGFSPVVTVTKDGTVATISITDRTGTTTTTISDGEKGDTGDTGATPSFSIGTVETGDPDSDAEVTMSGTQEEPVLNFLIPQGADGDATVDDTAGAGDTTHVWSANKTNKEISDLKTAFSDITGANLVDNFVSGRIDTPAVGSVATLTRVSSTMVSAIVDCSAGDVFTINVKGGTNARAYAFIDSSNAVLSRDSDGAVRTNYKITAPTNASKLIINTYKTFDNGDACYVVFGDFKDNLLTKAKENDKEIQQLSDGIGMIPLVWENRAIDSSTGQETDNANRLCTKELIPFKDVVNLKATINGSYTILPRIYNANNEYLCNANDITDDFQMNRFVDSSSYYSTTWTNNKAQIQSGNIKIRFVVKASPDRAMSTDETPIILSPTLAEKFISVEQKVGESVIDYDELFPEVVSATWEWGGIKNSDGTNTDDATRIRTNGFFAYNDIKNYRVVTRGDFAVLPRIYDLSGSYLCATKDMPTDFPVSDLIEESSYYAADWTAYGSQISAGNIKIRFVVRPATDYILDAFHSPVKITSFYQDLQTHFDKGGSVVLPPSVKVHINSSVTIDTSKVKRFDGNNSVVVVHGDITAFSVTGTVSTGTDPDALPDSILKIQALTCIENVRVFSDIEGEGTAFSFSGVFKTNVSNVLAGKMKVGFSFQNYCRDMIISDCQIYAMELYGLWFTNTVNFHQLNVVGCNICFAKYSVFYDGCKQIANHQYSGNDIEIVSYPDSAVTYGRCIKMDLGETESGLFSEIAFTGNTIQGHGFSDALVELKGSELRRILYFTFIGNIVSNSNADGIIIDKMQNATFSGNVYGSMNGSVFIIGDISDVRINGESAIYSGRFIKNADTCIMKNVGISNNNINTKITGGRAIYISSGTAERVLINGNIISGTNPVVDVNPTTAEKCMVTGNVNEGTYSIKEGITATNNI